MHFVYYRTWRERRAPAQGFWHHRAPKTYWMEVGPPAGQSGASNCVWIIPGTYVDED